MVFAGPVPYHLATAPLNHSRCLQSQKTKNPPARTSRRWVKKKLDLESGRYRALATPPMPEDTQAQARQQHGVRTAPAMAMNLIYVMLARNRIAVNRAAPIGFAHYQTS
jgi:hypothetical protein